MNSEVINVFFVVTPNYLTQRKYAETTRQNGKNKAPCHFPFSKISGFFLVMPSKTSHLPNKKNKHLVILDFCDADRCVENAGEFNGDVHPMGSQSVKKYQPNKQIPWFRPCVFRLYIPWGFGWIFVLPGLLVIFSLSSRVEGKVGWGHDSLPSLKLT